jgi:hypothetical protein
MAKKLVRLTESDLHNIIKNSVNKVLREICEIDDFSNHELMNSNWSENGNSIYDDNLKRKQMQKDWEDSELFDRRELEYYDLSMEDNYTNDFNSNINDYWKDKDTLPF